MKYIWTVEMKTEKHCKYINPNEFSIYTNHIIKQTKYTEKTKEKGRRGEEPGCALRLCP